MFLETEVYGRRKKEKFYYRSMGNEKGFERAAEVEEDRRLMESYYPRKAGLLKALVTDQCDRLEYEGSFIYDEYPDRRNIERICRGTLQSGPGLSGASGHGKREGKKKQSFWEN